MSSYAKPPLARSATVAGKLESDLTEKEVTRRVNEEVSRQLSLMLENGPIKVPKAPVEARTAMLWRPTASLRARMEVALFSQLEGGVPYGAYQNFIAAAVLEYLKKGEKGEEV